MIIGFIILFVHIIGAITMLIYSKRTGVMKDAKLHGDDIRYPTPATIVFMNLTMWEIVVLVLLFQKLADYINNMDW